MLNDELWKSSAGIYLIRRPTVDATTHYKRYKR